MIKQIQFCDKKMHNIVSNEYKKYILDTIFNKYSISINHHPKKYSNRNNELIQNNNFIMSFVSNQYNYYYLYLTKNYNNNQNICYLINLNTRNGHEYPQILIANFRFKDLLFETDTIFLGELIKNNQDQWCFYIDGLPVYLNKKTNHISKVKELEIIIDILSNDIKYDSYLQPFDILCKQFYDCNQINKVINEIIPSLKHNCKGLYFYNNKTKDKIFYYFKHVIPFAVSNTTDITKNINTHKHKTIETNTINNSINKNNSEIISQIKNLNFKIVKTMQIDIYKLYLQKKTKEYKKFSYAHIPDISTSQFLQKIFETHQDFC